MRLIDFHKDKDWVEAHLHFGYPHVFLKKYAQFEISQGSNYLLIHDEATGSHLPLRLRRRAGLTEADLMFPPMADAARLQPADEKKFYETMLRFLKGNRITDRIGVSYLLELSIAQPAGSVSCEYGIYVLKLEGDASDIFKRFAPNYRNEIRKAQSEGCQVRFGKSELTQFYALYERLYLSEGMQPKPLSFFSNLASHLEGNILTGAVYRGEEVLGAIVVPYSGYAADYQFGAGSADSPVPGAMKLLHYEAIQSLMAAGAKRYVMGGVRLNEQPGTREAGIAKFKERFGAQIERGVLWKQDISKMKCRLSDAAGYFLARLKNRQPYTDMIDKTLKDRHP